MSRLSTPALAALAALVGLGNALTAPAVHADGDGEQAANVAPQVLPADAFLTGEARRDAVRLDGLDVHLERVEGNKLALVVHNPGHEPGRLARTADVIVTEGSMASRMGPMPMVVASVPLAVEVAPGETARKVFGGVALRELPAVPAEGEQMPVSLFMDFQSVEVNLTAPGRAEEGDRIALVEPSPLAAGNTGAALVATEGLSRVGDLGRARGR